MGCDGGFDPGTNIDGAICRIEEMERCFDELQAMLFSGGEVARSDEHAAVFIEKLSGYYGSSLWKYDLELDETGRLPSGLKRGVLSEDGIYNLLCDISAQGEG